MMVVILDEAQETLVSLSLQGQKQMQTMQREVETLQVRATTDPLTGLATRARFDEFFGEQFTRAYAHQRPLSLCARRESCSLPATTRIPSIDSFHPWGRRLPMAPLREWVWGGWTLWALKTTPSSMTNSG